MLKSFIFKAHFREYIYLNCAFKKYLSLSLAELCVNVLYCDAPLNGEK